MNYKNKTIIITVLVLIFVLGFLYWFFLSSKNTKTSLVRLTDQQKIAILSATSSEPVKVISYDEKQEILNKLDVTIKKPMIDFSDEEKLQILNKIN